MLINEIDDLLVAVQIKQSKYKYDFISETKFNQYTKRVGKYYSIVKYHTEVIDNKRVKIKDEAKRGNLISILTYLNQELKGYGSA